jgi:broad specificity phosphatase PhoE
MSEDFRRAEKIMVVRHAEKPTNSPPPYGVTDEGEREGESLAVRGWQRAGALAALLAPQDGSFQHPSLAEPRFIYASRPTKRNGSRRPLETITPLAEKLAIRVNDHFPKGDYEEMLEEVLLCRGVVLVSWQHEFIPKIANRVLGDETTAPQEWPAERYDVIWVFDRDQTSGLYTFTQAPQNLLMGDRLLPIRT